MILHILLIIHFDLLDYYSFLLIRIILISIINLNHHSDLLSILRFHQFIFSTCNFILVFIQYLFSDYLLSLEFTHYIF